MKPILQSSFITLSILLATTSFAAQSSSTDINLQLLQEVKEVTAEAKELKQEVSSLKREVRSLERDRHREEVHVAELPTTPAEPVSEAGTAPEIAAPAVERRKVHVAQPPMSEPAAGAISPPTTDHVTVHTASGVPVDISTPTHRARGDVFNPQGQYFTAGRFVHAVTVTTSPFLGLRTAFDASDLLYEYPSMNEDLLLLKQRQTFEHELNAYGGTLDNRAIIAISGAIEGQMYQGTTYNGDSIGDIDLVTGEIDISAMISRWANTFFSLDYDDSAPQTGSRVTNSRIYLNRGFLTIGNVDVTPIYFSIGQMYSPFGKYSSLMLTTPLTKSVARINARNAILGYTNGGLYAEAYAFDGDRKTGMNWVFRQGGGNIGYQTDIGADNNIDFGTGIVSNIADSEGMQRNGLPYLSPIIYPPGQFAGFGNTEFGNNLVYNVPAIDGHLEYTWGRFVLLGEYVSVLDSFSPLDLTYDGHGANVSVVHTELDYNMKIGDHPLSFGLVYGQTWQSLALSLPKNTYAFVISTSIWKNTMIGLEYRHDENYPSSSTASGHGLPVPNGGGAQNLITVQVGAYF